MQPLSNPYGCYDLLDAGVAVCRARSGKAEILYLNPAMRAAFRPEELARAYEDGPELLIDENDREDAVRKAKAALARREAFSLDCRLGRRDGLTQRYKLTVSVRPEGEGALRLYACAVATETPEDLERCRGVERLKEAMETMAGGLAIMRQHPDGSVEVEYINQGLADMMHATRGEMLALYGRDAYAGVHPDDRDKVRAAEQKMLECGRGTADYRLKNAAGKYFWVNSTMRMLPREGGCNTIVASYANIDAFMELQAKLSLAQQRYEYAWETSSSGRWEYDIDQDLLIFSPSYLERAKRLLPGVMTGESVGVEKLLSSGAVAPESRWAYRELHQKLREGASFTEDVICCRDPDGSARYYYIQYSAMPIQSGARIAMAVSRDVTGQKKLEKQYEDLLAIREHDQGSQNFLLNLTRDTCVLVRDENGQEAPELTDGGVDAFFNWAATFLVGEESRARHRALCRRDRLLALYRDGKTEQALLLKVMDRRRGRPRWFSYRLVMVSNPSTGDVMAFGSGLDVTEQELNNELLAKAAYQNFDFVALVDLADDTYRMVGANNALEHLIPSSGRYSECCRRVTDSIVDRSDRDKNHAMLQIQHIREHLEKEELLSFSFSHKDARGAAHVARIQAYYVDRDLQTVCVCRTDVTDAVRTQQRQKEELAAALEAAKQASAAKSDFLSRMSHEIRTPLNAILGISFLGRDAADAGQAALYFDKIHASGEFLLGIINDILDMSRIESGKLELHASCERRPEVLQSVLEMVSVPAREKNITLAADFTRTYTEWVVMDRLRFKQIQVNLLNNAIKFSEPGGRVEWTVSETPVDAAHARMECRVRDHGVGMSEAFQQRLFQPFEQEYSRFSDGRAGTGLGLSIVKSIVDKLGGSISVSSQPGEGSEFVVVFELEVCPPPETERGAKEDGPSLRRLKGMRVLVAEDNETNAKITRLILERAGVEVIGARDGREAVEAFQAQERGAVSAILMDVRMPVMDGLEATRAIRALDRPDAARVPIIAMTADAFANDRMQTREAGMDAHLSKPVEPQAIYDALEALAAPAAPPEGAAGRAFHP